MGKEPNKTNNSAKPGTQKLSKREVADREEARARRTKMWLVIFAVVALISIVASIVVVLIVNHYKNKKLDYVSDDLSRYVYLSREDYSSFPVEILLEEVTDRDVEDALLRVLCANRSSSPLYGGANLTEGVMGPGDVLNIYYRGYILDENGNPDYFDGGCNFSGTLDSQTLGSDTDRLFTGFELGLVGKNPKNYSSYQIKTEGKVEKDDIIVINYTVFYGDGSFKRDVTDTVSLSEVSLDKEYGEGFGAYFVGKDIGKKLEGTLTVDGENGIDDVYGDIVIQKAVKVGANPLVVEAYAPKSIDSEKIAGKTTFFEVYVRGFQDYEVPNLDESFITKTLKLSEEDLEDYEGNTLIEKYRSKLKAELIEERDKENKHTIESAMWEHYLSKAKFKRLPKNEVKACFNEYYNELYDQYESYSYAYDSFDDFATATLELDKGESWEDALMADAESAIKDKLLFYYVITQEGFIPDNAEFKRLYDQAIEDHIVDYIENAYKDKEFTADEYNSVVKNVKIIVLDYYGEDYFKENAYYTYAIDKILGFAKITYK